MDKESMSFDTSVKGFNGLTPTDNSSSEGVNIVKLLKNKGFNGLTPIADMFRLSDCKYQGKPAVRIPYLDENGKETAIRYRTALIAKEGSRWRQGSKTTLYGLHLMDKILSQGYVLLVEGETDTWTGWYCGIPTIGVPGKTNWKSSFASPLKDIDVYVWQEPDAEDFPRRIYGDLPNLNVIVAPEGIKDINELLQQGKDVKKIVDKLINGAIPYAQIAQNELSEQAKEAKAKAALLMQSKNPLAIIAKAIKAQGYGGDIKKPLIVYLAATSRLLAMRVGAMPVHLLLKGLPSAGKSYTLKLVLNFLPAEAYHVIDAGSPRALIYDKEDLKHKLVVFSEADSLPAGEDNPAASAIRNLLQDGHLHYVVAAKNPGTGEYVVKEIVKPGPTTMITTSTKHLGAQLESRLFILDVQDNNSQIMAALKAQAALELNEPASINEALIAYQHYMQLSAPFKVFVPCAEAIANHIGKTPGVNSRILRDYARLISLIKAAALLQHTQRETDEQGRIIAQPDDYRLVYFLVRDMYTASVTGAGQAIRETVQAVAELKEAGQKKITISDVAKKLQISVAAARKRINRAIYGGWLINEESRDRRPADLTIGEPLPDNEVLPKPAELCSGCVTRETLGFNCGLTQNNATDQQEQVAVKPLNPLTDVSKDTHFNDEEPTIEEFESLGFREVMEL